MPGGMGAQPYEMRDFGNPEVLRHAIYDKALTAAKNFQPVVGPRYTLALSDVSYADPESYTKADEKRALLEGQSLGRRLRGTWQLRDSITNDVIDSKHSTLGSIPYLTPRGTFIFRGNDYVLAHQMRLSPGIFTREKESGELESHVNVARGHGHRYFLDPATGVFRAEFGQSRMPLISILRALGAKDEQLQEAWGNEIYMANVKKDNPGVLRKVYRKLRHADAPPNASVEQTVRDAFAHMLLDPDVTRHTLGQPYDKVDPTTILAATKKLLRVYRKEEEPDDRDNMAFQRVMGPEDLFAERITKSRDAVRKLLWRAAAAGSLRTAPAGTFNKAITNVLLESGLGNAVEEINPAELYDQMWRVTRMGEGGIPSMDAVPDSSRNVHSSQFGFVDPIATPESGRTGVDNRLAYNTRKGPGGLLYSRYLNPKTGREEWKSPRDILDTTVAFPQELESGEPYVRAIVKGKHRLVPRDKVDLQLVDMTEAMGPLANMVAMKHAAYPQRIAMGARMLTQALPMVNAEAPLVQSGIPGTSESFEDRLGEKMGAIRSQVAGTVINVTPETITIQGDGKKKHTIELYNDLPYNRKTTIHNTPLVSVGQHVKPGMLLAKSNFTDNNGTTALGLNYHVAFMPYKGYNYEDAIVMSESAAKRATSEHMYQHTLDTDDVQANKNTFVSIFPAKYPAKLLENYDENGVIKPGTTVNPDDPLILAVKERTTGPRVGRRRSWADASVSWHHEASGVVTDVAQSKNGINVIVKSTQATQVGDKFANRYGGKGILSAIIPDDQMPRDANGRPFEILLNELGVISRQNPSQYIELMLGKVADKTGKPYKLPDYHTAGQLRRLAESELKKHQLSDTEDVEDPDTGRKISGIPTGKMFIMKLHHTAESKAQGRAAGGEAGYTAEGVPAKGGETGAKRVGTMELNALLSLGAYNVIRDAGVVRGQRNEDYWRQIMSGYHAPEPKVPFVYEKFMNQLKGAGINPVRTGTRINIMAMTNADVKHLTGNRKIQNSKTVDWRVDQLTPIYGGLFDERLTGGHDGKQWAYIQLTEAMPNPVMEDPIRYLLGLTKDQYEGIIAGRSHYGNDEPGIGVPKNTGPQAIAKALSELDIDKEMAKAKAAIDSGRKSDRDMAIRRYGYLKACKQNKQHPKDWMLDRAPVLPPMFRAVSKMQGSDRPMVADANYLYKELFDANEALTTMRAQVDDVSDERLAVYKALRAAVGLGDPIQPKSREQGVKGLLKEIFGSGPKWGMVQRKLLGATVDLVGGATITPNPNLDMDQVGLPVDKAWAIYKPFIVRSLVRRGMPKLQARREVEDRTPSALKALQHEMTQRPVMVTRAPALHRYNMLAFWPQLTRHNTLEVPPVVCGGFNADFDGDRMQFHVPADDSAVKDAIDKMLPSKNLLAASSFKAHYIPNREFLAGLWKASTKVDHNRPRRVYKTAQDAIKAYRRGEINADQQVEIVER